MCRNLAIESMDSFDILESKLSLSTVVSAHTVTVALVDDPRPAPEPDPGDLPTDDPPIIYPPIPPSGPVGPG